MLTYSVLMCGEGNLSFCQAIMGSITDDFHHTSFCDVNFLRSSCQYLEYEVAKHLYMSFLGTFHTRICLSIIGRTPEIAQMSSSPLNNIHPDIHMVNIEATKMQGVRGYISSMTCPVGMIYITSFAKHMEGPLTQARGLSSSGRKVEGISGQFFRIVRIEAKVKCFA